VALYSALQASNAWALAKEARRVHERSHLRDLLIAHTAGAARSLVR
jgi:hypothetical protein